jgi:hypothetical protein
MNIDLILYLAVSVVAVLALAGTLLTVAWSLFIDSLPKLPPRATKVELDKHTVILVPQADGSTNIILRRRNRTRRPKA